MTPSFNQAAYLAETMTSVLSQGYPDLEYFVLDGGSTDGSVGIIRAYESRISFWRSHADEGQAAALAEGFARASGDILGWLNSDDTLEPGALSAVGDFFARNPDVEVLYGNMNFVDVSGRKLFTAYPVLDLGVLLYDNRFIPQQAMFWRKGLYERAGGIDPGFRFAMDFDLTLRFLRAGARVAKVHRILANFRVHPDAKSSTIRDIMVSEANSAISRHFPSSEGRWTRFLKKIYFRGVRFFREPGSFAAAVRSRVH